MKRAYTANGQRIQLDVDPTVVAVRFREPAPMSMRATVAAGAALGPFPDRQELVREKYTILPVGEAGLANDQRVTAKLDALNARDEVARAAPVYKLGSRQLVATDRVLVGFRSGTAEAKARLKQRGLEIVEQRGDEYLVRLGEYEDPFEVADQLGAMPEVDYSEPDFVIIGPRTPLPRDDRSRRPNGSDDPHAADQYALRLTRADEAQDRQKGSRDVRIAILDEGVDSAHEDLKDAVVGAYDATDDDTYQEPNAHDAHGTACAGLAAAVARNGRGVRGIGAGCSLLAVRLAYGAVGGGWVTSNSWIARAADWSWQNGAWILSNSWGGGVPSTAITRAFERARSQGRDGKGAVIVVAAGNDDGPVNYPASLENVVAVAASNQFDEPKTRLSRDGEGWWGSCFGPEVTVAAPGVGNYTTDISGERGYNQAAGAAGNYVPNFNGTSSATPIVAGAIGLMLSANPDLTEADVREILCATAVRLQGLEYVNGRNDHVGFGRIDVLAAVEEAQRRKGGGKMPGSGLELAKRGAA